MRLGACAIERELGRGGMGVVLAARAQDGRAVAIERLLQPRAHAAVERLERERRLLADLGWRSRGATTARSAASTSTPGARSPRARDGE